MSINCDDCRFIGTKGCGKLLSAKFLFVKQAGGVEKFGIKALNLRKCYREFSIFS